MFNAFALFNKGLLLLFLFLDTMGVDLCGSKRHVHNQNQQFLKEGKKFLAFLFYGLCDCRFFLLSSVICHIINKIGTANHEYLISYCLSLSILVGFLCNISLPLK